MNIKLLKYIITVVITGLIVFLAWQSGENQPPPEWVIEYLVPFLGWAYIVLVIVAIAGRKKTKHDKPDANR